MATQTSFSHQIQLAEDLKKYLENLHERLFFVTTDYNNKVTVFASAHTVLLTARKTTANLHVDIV